MSEPASEILSSPALVTALMALGGSIGALAKAVHYYAGRVKEAESKKRSNLSEYVRRSDQQWLEWREQDAKEKKALSDRLDALLQSPRIIGGTDSSDGNGGGYPKEPKQ